MSDIAITVESLSKQYYIGLLRKKKETLAEAVADRFVAPLRRAAKLLSGQATGAAELDQVIWALKDVSFKVTCGEVVGVIGRNGAGKSTLLKVLSRITEPTEGYAEIQGRVGSLLEVGTGFHPELTGRENTYLNGTILGMIRAEIDRQFDEIVAFSEIRKFIDTPVKHYSTGMRVRLAFAIAAHLQPEILIVDEVLAVGDSTFQRKCLGKMDEIAGGGRTVLFVSHNMGTIAQLCDRVLWIENGKLKMDGSPTKVIEAYLSFGSEGYSSTWYNSSPTPCEAEVQIHSTRLLSRDDQPSTVVNFNSSFKVEISYEIIRPTRNLSIYHCVTNSGGNAVWLSWDTDTTEWKERLRKPGHYVSTCKVPASLLRPGRYHLSVGALVDGIKGITSHQGILAFDVSEVGYPLNRERTGVITPLLEWEVKRSSRELVAAEQTPRTT